MISSKDAGFPDDGVYRYDDLGNRARLAANDRGAGLVVHPVTGDIYASEPNFGRVYRTEFGGTGRSTWVSDLHPGDDDPIGIAIAPANYTGPLVSPGEGIVVDRGFNSEDGVFAFSTTAAGVGIPLADDNSVLEDAVDVAVTSTAIYIADAVGVIYELGASGLVPVTTSESILMPLGIAVDPLTEDLLVLDYGEQRVVRLNPSTGFVSPVFSNLSIAPNTFAGIDVSPDGTRIVISDRLNDAIYLFRFQTQDAYQASPGEVSTLTKNPNGSFTRTFPDKSRIEYDALGRQVTEIDRNGNTTSLEYDSQSRLVRVTDAVGQQTNIAYAGARISSITDPANRTTNFEHSSSGDLTRIEFPDGTDKRFTYDNQHRLIAEESTTGFTTRHQYDDFGRYKSSTWPDGSSPQSAAYNLAGLFDGQTAGTESSPAPALRPNERRATYVDGLGRESTAEMARRGQIVASENTAGLTTQGARDLDDNLTAVTYPSGETRAYSYDENGNLTASADPLHGANYGFTHDAEFNELSSITSPSGGTTSMVRDANGNLTSVTTELGRTEAATYDGSGNVETTTSALGTVTTIVRDAFENVVSVTEGSGADARTTSYGRDAVGRVTTITDAESSSLSIGYDLWNRPVSLTEPDNRTTNLSYNDFGDLTSLTTPANRTHHFDYGRNGQLSAYRAPEISGNAFITEFEYDASQALERVTWPDSRSMSLLYDFAGRPETVRIAEGDYTTVYDSLTGLVSAISSADGTALAFDYIGALLTSQTWSGEVSGQVSVSYDTTRRVSSVSVAGGESVAYTYDLDENPETGGAITLVRDAVSGLVSDAPLGATNTTFGYNAFEEITSTVTTHLGNPVYSEVYERDKVGRVTKRTETLSGTTTVYDFVYDAEYRLAQVIRNGAVVEDFDYDISDNLVQYSTPTTISAGVYDEQDRQLEFRGAQYSYNAAGQLTQKVDPSGTTLFSYDVLGNLLSVTLPNGDVISYIIDGLGRRVGKKRNGVFVKGWLYLDGLSPIAELNSSGVVETTFVYLTSVNVPDYFIRSGQTYRIVTDARGSPRVVMDVVSGAIVQRIDYNAFGQKTFDSSPGFQPFAFVGGLDDTDTGLVRLGRSRLRPRRCPFHRQRPDPHRRRSKQLLRLRRQRPRQPI